MSFFQELKRRNVIRVAVMYAVASWLILQVADVLFGLIGVPEWSLRLVFGILVLGFPIAVIFSWIYELTPDGLKRDSDIEQPSQQPHQTSQKLNIATAVLVLIGIGVVTVDRLLPEDGGRVTAESQALPGQDKAESPLPSPDSDRPSIAVLPFENFSGNEEDEYFSDGLSDTVLHQLAQIPNLKVIARNSSFQFKGTNLDVREVGERLGVTNVLEGSVQRYGDQVRVIAQLIRTSDGTHVWSESFDYEMENIFALHDAIAMAVTEHMKVSLLPEDVAQIDLGGTDNPQAYDQLLKASGAFWTTFTPAVAEKIDPDESYPPMELLDEALALDPNYVDALIFKIRMYNMFAFQTTSIRRMQEYVSRARPLVERALELAPEYSSVWAAKGSIAHRSGNTDEAVAALRKAISLNPNDADAHLGLAVAVGMSNPTETIEQMRIFHRLDPENPFNRPTVLALGRLNRIDEAIQELESGLAGNSALDQMIMDDLADIHYVALGRPDESARWAGKLLALQPDSPRGAQSMARTWMAVGDLDRAERWLESQASADTGWSWSKVDEIRLKAMQGDLASARATLDAAGRPQGPTAGMALGAEARLCLRMNDLECAAAAVTGLEHALDQATARGMMTTWWRGSQQLLSATVDTRTGGSPNAEAQAIVEATRTMPRTSWYGDGIFYSDAEAYVLLGETGLALTALEEALLPEGGYIPFDSFGVPADQGLVLSEMDGNPRFEDWKKRFGERREAMRKKMIEMEEAGEFPAPPGEIK